MFHVIGACNETSLSLPHLYWTPKLHDLLENITSFLIKANVWKKYPGLLTKVITVIKLDQHEL